MGFENIQRPGFLTGSGEALSPFVTEQMVIQELSNLEKIRATERSDSSANVKSREKERRGKGEESLEEHLNKNLSQEEREQILALAKLRKKLFRESDDAAEDATIKDFRIRLNRLTGRFELFDLDTGRRIGAITPQDLVELAMGLNRSSGLLTDQFG